MNKSSYYISCSRRTDIPRFFYKEFYSAWQKGEIKYNCGFNKQYTVSLKTENVLGYIFWSKDFSFFISHPLFKNLFAENNAVFHFTINNCLELEPNVCSLEKRINTLFLLCEIVGPQRVLWRFDPICKYRNIDNKKKTNYQAFFDILPHIKKAGITRCYFSFMTHYKKHKSRKILFEEFTQEEKENICKELVDAASFANIEIYNCCNPDVLLINPKIKKAHCIDNNILAQTDRFNRHKQLSLKPTRAGCGCFESKDIGSYFQKCPHSCLYCYANPA
jgi:hypothetical protein